MIGRGHCGSHRAPVPRQRNIQLRTVRLLRQTREHLLLQALIAARLQGLLKVRPIPLRFHFQKVSALCECSLFGP